MMIIYEKNKQPVIHKMRKKNFEYALKTIELPSSHDASCLAYENIPPHL